MKYDPVNKLYEEENTGRRFVIKSRCKYSNDWQYAFFEIFKPGPKVAIPQDYLPRFRSHSDYINENGLMELRENDTNLLRFYFEGSQVLMSEQKKPRKIIGWLDYEEETKTQAETWLRLEFQEVKQ